MAERYEREIDELLAYKARKEAAQRRRRVTLGGSVVLMRLGLALVVIGLVVTHLAALDLAGAGQYVLVAGGVCVLLSWIRSYTEPPGGDSGYDGGRRWRGRVV